MSRRGLSALLAAALLAVPIAVAETPAPRARIATPSPRVEPPTPARHPAASHPSAAYPTGPAPPHRRLAPPPRRPCHPTGWCALDHAIARLPGYHDHPTVWVVSSVWGHWGFTDLSSGWITIEPSVPAWALYSVVAHEWAMSVAAADYAFDFQQWPRSAARWTGRENGFELLADCAARELGAPWTYFTACTDRHWRAGAARLLAGHRLEPDSP